MKVVGLSGAQGGGKSSLLIELQARGWALDQFRVSRAVQAQLGWETLNVVMESWDAMVSFQEEVFKQKFEHDFALTKLEGDVILTERTFADIMAYTALWTWRHVDRGNVPLNDAVKWLNGYMHGCIHGQLQVYEATMLLPYMADVVKWEEDPKRAMLKDVDTVYEDVCRFLEHGLLLKQKKLTISAKSVSERADQVQVFLRSL